MKRLARRAGPALRVAIAATVIAGVAYVAGAVALYYFAAHRLTSAADTRIGEQLSKAGHGKNVTSMPPAPGGMGGADPDGDDGPSPVYLWSLTGSGRVIGNSPGAPSWPASLKPQAGPGTVSINGSSLRVRAEQHDGGWLIAGASRAGDLHTEHLLVDGELLAGPVLLLAMFGGALIVGLRALAPVELARRRQVEFTADASHELRTPLSVITAEVDVALTTDRSADQYRDVLLRVRGETGRLRRLVDDMLWLARSDSQAPLPADELVDLGTLAQTCADRFRAVGPAITADAGSALISAPPEWIDRLAGVLMDNACRYAGRDGQVRIGVQSHGNRVSLTVEDSGPGIPEAGREQLFDRFQRATDDTSGTGLGLAIGDVIVRATGGRWHTGDSTLGGALMEVSWRQARLVLRLQEAVPG